MATVLTRGGPHTILFYPQGTTTSLIMIFLGGTERRLTASRQCLVAKRTEKIGGAVRLITSFLSAVGNKILITSPAAPGSSRQMDVCFPVALSLPLAGRNSKKEAAAPTEGLGCWQATMGEQAIPLPDSVTT